MAREMEQQVAGHCVACNRGWDNVGNNFVSPLIFLYQLTTVVSVLRDPQRDDSFK